MVFTLYSLDRSSIANRSVTIDGCDLDEDFDLTQCKTSVLTSPCTTNALAWVQCTLGCKDWTNIKVAHVLLLV